ncbi:MAG: DUF2269 domain-containing protein [Acidobacteria bacterium]|nr:DUF2269 domain-containing protein [Acidobacteriota bacterium]
MIMTPGVRRFALTTHVTASVGWLGAVVVFLAHAAIGLTNQNPQIVRGVYLVMEPAAWVALLPLAVAALLTGVVQSLGTTWGLFRHYWVVCKLLITAGATAILLIYMETFRQMAAVAADPRVDVAAVGNPSPALHAVLALAALLIATVLGICKPAGLTPYGRRIRGESLQPERRSAAATWLYATAGLAILAMLMLIAVHLTGHRPPSH